MYNFNKVIESLKDYLESRYNGSFFIAGDGKFWIKCDTEEAAKRTGFQYIFYIYFKEITLISC